MLDRFVYGDVRRVSPEAPVPVLLKAREEVMLGGAGNVARNIAALSGRAVLIGAIGNDQAGSDICRLIGKNWNIKNSSVSLDNFITIEKNRFVSHQQQLMRVDIEGNGAVDIEPILHAFDEEIPFADAVIISDYAKGVILPKLVQHVMDAAHKIDVPVIVDPKAKDLTCYDGATLITPNRHEAEAATGIVVENDDDSEHAARTILASAPRISAVAITRGEMGMSLLERGALPSHLRTVAREVFDVSGAGDTVVAVLALGLACGLPLKEVVPIANAAAGIVVGKPGTATVSCDELDRSIKGLHGIMLQEKVLSLGQILAQVEIWRNRGERIGFTNGCFDLLHPGHVSLLIQARSQCDRLIVGLNSDDSIKRLKGTSRPVQDEIARGIVLASLSSVDLVTVFRQDTPLELISAIRPDVLIKGRDYEIDQVVGAKEVQSWGGRVYLADLTPGHSTTGTITRMKGD